MYIFLSTLCNIVSSFFAFICWCDFCVVFGLLFFCGQWWCDKKNWFNIIREGIEPTRKFVFTYKMRIRISEKGASMHRKKAIATALSREVSITIHWKQDETGASYTCQLGLRGRGWIGWQINSPWLVPCLQLDPRVECKFIALRGNC